MASDHLNYHTESYPSVSDTKLLGDRCTKWTINNFTVDSSVILHTKNTHYDAKNYRVAIRGKTAMASEDCWKIDDAHPCIMRGYGTDFMLEFGIEGKANHNHTATGLEKGLALLEFVSNSKIKKRDLIIEAKTQPKAAPTPIANPNQMLVDGEPAVSWEMTPLTTLGLSLPVTGKFTLTPAHYHRIDGIPSGHCQIEAAGLNFKAKWEMIGKSYDFAFKSDGPVKVMSHPLFDMTAPKIAPAAPTPTPPALNPKAPPTEIRRVTDRQGAIDRLAIVLSGTKLVSGKDMNGNFFGTRVYHNPDRSLEAAPFIAQSRDGSLYLAGTYHTAFPQSFQPGTRFQITLLDKHGIECRFTAESVQCANEITVGPHGQRDYEITYESRGGIVLDFRTGNPPKELAGSLTIIE